MMKKQPAGESGDFITEAQLALADLGDDVVAEKYLSNRLNNPQQISIAYLNIKSKVDREFCIELSQRGYRIVGNRFDDNSQLTTQYYESLQALLSTESKSYVNCFAESLKQKLCEEQHKQQQRNQNNNSDDEDAFG